MKPLFHIAPNIAYSYQLEQHLSDIESGYASQVQSTGNQTVLLFQDVEDHIDGNGLALLWLTQGCGTFMAGRKSI